MLFVLLSSCDQDRIKASISEDKDAALRYPKTQFVLKPFDAYHLLKVPDAIQCDDLLDETGVFTDTRAYELAFLQNLDSFYAVEGASLILALDPARSTGNFILHTTPLKGYRGCITLGK